MVSRGEAFIGQVMESPYWVNLSKRGGMDGILRGPAGLLQGISRGPSQGKSRGAVLLGRGKIFPYQLLNSEMHSISNRFFKVTYKSNILTHFQKPLESLKGASHLGVTLVLTECILTEVPV